MLPNVRVLRVEWDNEELGDIGGDGDTYYDEAIEVRYSESKIKVLSDCIHCEIASQMLMSNLCEQLETLGLNFASTNIISIVVLLAQLKNLPVLKNLTFRAITIRIHDLENIQNDIPTIEDFQLDWIDIRRSEIPSLVSATSLATSLYVFIHEVEDIEAQMLMYQYMAKKYRNVANIIYCDQEIISHGHDYAAQVYANGLLDFYKLSIHLDTKATTLRGVPDYVNLFKVINDSGCELEKLHVYSRSSKSFSQNLAQSNQLKYIRMMELRSTRINPLNNLCNMASLTTLELDLRLYKWPVNLTDYLNGCPPTLKSFSVDCNHLEIDVYNTQLSFIETLHISSKWVSTRLGELISTLFPKLINLHISGELVEHTSFMLHNQCYWRVEFFFRNESLYTLIFKSLNNIKLQHYHIRQDEYHIITYEEIVHSLILSVTCFTDKSLHLSYNIVIE